MKLLAIAAALWMGSLSSLMAQTLVVNWGGKYLPDGATSATLDYGSHTIVDTPLTGTSVRRNWLYSNTVKLSPSPSQYIPAQGRSGTFYGALQNIDSRGGYAYSRARVDANGASDTLYLWGSDPGAGQTSKITGLIYFKGEHFLGTESGQTFTLATTNSFSLQGSMAGDSRRIRFAVLNAGSGMFPIPALGMEPPGLSIMRPMICGRYGIQQGVNCKTFSITTLSTSPFPESPCSTSRRLASLMN